MELNDLRLDLRLGLTNEHNGSGGDIPAGALMDKDGFLLQDSEGNYMLSTEV